MVVNVNITEPAQGYLAELLSKQDGEGVGIRMFVANPGTPKAETCIAYCNADDRDESDIKIEYDAFNAYFEERSVPFLENAKVDYSADRMGGQLTIRAPNSKMPQVSEDGPLEDKVNYVLFNDVNPGLAAHGGHVDLVEITEDMFAVLMFGGGCQGCSAVDLTLKEGVEKTLIEKLPELKGVRDSTDHTDKTEAFM